MSVLHRLILELLKMPRRDQDLFKSIEVGLLVEVCIWNGMLFDDRDGVISSHDSLKCGLPPIILIRFPHLHVGHASEVILG